jgi:hypothetical protein
MDGGHKLPSHARHRDQRRCSVSESSASCKHDSPFGGCDASKHPLPAQADLEGRPSHRSGLQFSIWSASFWARLPRECTWRWRLVREVGTVVSGSPYFAGLDALFWVDRLDGGGVVLQVVPRT